MTAMPKPSDLARPRPAPSPASDPAPADAIDLSEVNDLLQVISERLPELDGKTLNPKITGRDRSAELAYLTKELLYLAHLCKKAETLVLDEYWVVKGQVAHLSR